MPLEQMPDGSFVNIEDGTPPEVLARIKSQHSQRKPLQVTVRPLSKKDQEVRSKVDELKSASSIPILGDALRGIDSLVHEGSFHADDVLTSGIDALGNLPEAVKSRSMAPIADRYDTNRKALRTYRGEIEEESPISTLAGGIVGAVKNPVGAATGVGKLASKLAPLFSKVPGSAVAAKAAEKIGMLGNSTVGQATRTGFNQAALAGLMDTGSLDAAFDQGTLGAAFGGGASGLIHGAGKVAQTIADRAPSNASNVAYSKIADMLSRTRRPGNPDMSYSPQAATRELRVSNARGVDARLMDLSPEMQAQAGWMARKPTLKAANELVETGENRAAGTADRFDDEVVRRVSSPTGNSAKALKDEIDFNRRATGAADYAPGGAMDTKIKWTPELNKFFEDSPDADRLIRQAYETATRFGDDLGTTMPMSPASTMRQVIPSMRVFDYLKREFDGEIGAALKSGNRTLAAGLSKHLQNLKSLISKANPEYDDILQRQRDEFQKLTSVEMGSTFLKQMGTRQGAQKLLADLRQAGQSNPDELRTGIADALLSMRNSADNPVRLMRRYMRSPDQRAVLEYAFGGTKNLNLFDRYMRRELRAAETDKLLARGKQSATNLFAQAGDNNADEAVGKLISNTGRGQAFGGPLGAAAGAVRTIDQLRRGIGPAAQEEVARILMGKGEGLAKGVDAAKRAAIARRVAERKRAMAAAKIGVFGLPPASKE